MKMNLRSMRYAREEFSPGLIPGNLVILDSSHSAAKLSIYQHMRGERVIARLFTKRTGCVVLARVDDWLLLYELGGVRFFATTVGLLVSFYSHGGRIEL